MSNRVNHRRRGRQDKRTETGPRWENPDPGAGCNSTHVAKGRKKWKRLAARVERRTDKVDTGKFWVTITKRVRPQVEDA